MCHTSEKFRHDCKISLEAVHEDGLALSVLPVEIKSDLEINLAAVC